MAPNRRVDPSDVTTLMEALELENERVPDYADENDDLSSVANSEVYGDMEIFLAELEAAEEDEDVARYAVQVRAYIGVPQGRPNTPEGEWVTSGVLPATSTEENNGGSSAVDAVVPSTSAGHSGWKFGSDGSIEATIDLQSHLQRAGMDGSARILVNEVGQRKMEGGRWVAAGGGESSSNHNASGETLVASHAATFTLTRNGTAYGDGVLQILDGNNLICERERSQNEEGTNEQGDAANLLRAFSHGDGTGNESAAEQGQQQQQQDENQGEQMESEAPERQGVMLSVWVRISCMQDLWNMDDDEDDDVDQE